ncbi:MAG: ATP-binding cassette domain-containing protein [Rhodothermales bacterium]
MIEVNGLTKTYGSERAVNAISFEVRQGEVLGFLGPNGAGKTTTMKVITCYLPPSEGTVLVDGLDVRKDGLEIRRKIGYLPEHTPLYHDMQVYDYLSFVAAMRGVPAGDRSNRIAQMADVCGLGSVLSKKIDALSKGYRQRVGLAQAMIHNPPIVILDEPTSGLDPNQIVEIRELIKAIGTERTVILSTHILSEVEASCDRVLIINKGSIEADGTPDELRTMYRGAQQIRFGLQHAGADVAPALEAWAKARITGQLVQDGETLFTLSTDLKEDLRPELFRMAVDRGWTLTELHRNQANLEDIFRQLTTTA